MVSDFSNDKQGDLTGLRGTVYNNVSFAVRCIARKGASIMPETIEQVILIAAAEGEAVTPRQVKRWQVAGLLASPDIQRLGKGKGTRTLYPDGTGKLAAVISARQERRLLYSAWSLWWEGFSVPLKSVRAFLHENLATRRQVLEGLTDKERECLSLQALEQRDSVEERDRTIPGSLRARQKLRSRDRFATLIGDMLVLATGTMKEGDLDRDAVETVFCPFGDWTTNPFGATVDYQLLSSFVPSVWNCELSDADMLKVREEARLLIEMFGYLASTLSQDLAEQWRFPIPKGEEQEVVFFAAWAKLRTLPGAALILVTAKQWVEPFRRFGRMLELLRIEVPAIAPLLTPDKMGVVGKSNRAGQRQFNRLNKAYEENKEGLDAFFQRHPEFRIPETENQ
jgi:hypothetical protein